MTLKTREIKNMHGVSQENGNSCSGEKKHEMKMNACGPI